MTYEDKIQIENENETEVLNKTNIKRSAFEIYNDAWKTFDEEKQVLEF